MPIDREEFQYLQKEVQDLKELVEALKSENLRVSDPQPLIASIPIPSPPRLEARSATKKRVRVQKSPAPPLTESEPPVLIPESEPLTESQSEEVMIEFPALE